MTPCVRVVAALSACVANEGALYTPGIAKGCCTCCCNWPEAMASC